MKRFFAMMLAMTMMGTTVYAAEKRETVTAKYVVQKIQVDDYSVKMEGYNINGYNYMRLRDVAEVMTDKSRDDCFKFDITKNRLQNRNLFMIFNFIFQNLLNILHL